MYIHPKSHNKYNPCACVSSLVEITNTKRLILYGKNIKKIKAKFQIFIIYKNGAST